MTFFDDQVGQSSSPPLTIDDSIAQLMASFGWPPPSSAVPASTPFNDPSTSPANNNSNTASLVYSPTHQAHKKSTQNDSPPPTASPAEHRNSNIRPIGSSSGRERQPTRSGRIPQRPDPNQAILNPLDFLDFPSDSESDDPDFLPGSSEDPSGAVASLHVHPPRRAGTRVQPHIQSPAPNHRGPGETDTTDRQNPTLNLPVTCSVTASGLHKDINSLPRGAKGGFAFSPPSDTHQHDWTNCFSSFGHEPTEPASHHPRNRPQRHSDSLAQEKAITVSDNESDGHHSPITGGALAGIPFVNINLPDSDDSPEFIPPPSKRGKKVPELSVDPLSPRQQRAPTPVRSRLNHKTSHASSSLRGSDSFDQWNHASSSSRSAILGRYVAIAPSPSGWSTDDVRSRQLRTRSPDEAEQLLLGSRACLTKAGRPRAKPGPKPKPRTEVDHGQREEFMKRKRECMRATRERKKEYIEELEDRCLALAEENARLRKENDQLLRESRENWRAKALGLGHQDSPALDSSDIDRSLPSVARARTGGRGGKPYLDGRGRLIGKPT